MTYEERLAKAREEIDFLWKQTTYWAIKDTDSDTLRAWRARWNTACNMYEILTGYRYDGE